MNYCAGYIRQQENQQLGIPREVARRFSPRLRQLVEEDEPRWPWAEPDRWPGSPGASLDELLSVHADRRATTTALLDALDDAGWERSGVHEVYGRLDVAGLMRRALSHDDEHIESLER